MGKELIIRDEETIRDAEALAEASGASVEEIVKNALAERARRLPPREGGAPTYEERMAALREISRRGSYLKDLGVSSNHDWLYDEHGLPK